MRLLLLIEYYPVCASTILKLASCLLLAIAFAWPTPTLAATITVDSSADTTTAGDGACTLREAVNNASGDSDSTGGDCAAGESGSDTIEISSSVNTITIASRLDFGLSPVTINGNGVTLDGNALRSSSGLILVYSNSSLSLNNATLEGGGHSGSGVLHLSGNLSLSNVTIRNFYRSAISTDLGSAITIALTNVLFEDGTGTYTSYRAAGLAMDIANHSTITVNNVVLRRLLGGNAAFNVGLNADASTIITLTGCLTAEAVYPQLTSGNVVNNSTGDCAGTIGNGDSAAREVATPVASSCGLPLEGVLVTDATYNLVADCQMTGTLYLTKGLTVTINGNGHTITSANGKRILQSAAKLTVNNVVFTGSGSSGPVLLLLQNDSIFRHVAFRDNQGPVTVADQNVEFDRVIFEMNTTTSTFGSAASALRHLLSGTVTVRNSIFRNNSGGAAAVYSGVSSGVGDAPRLTLTESVVFEGNSPQDRANEDSNFIDNSVSGAVLTDVGPFTPSSPQKGPKKRTTNVKENVIPQIKPRVQTCPALAPEITVTDLTGETQCQRIDARGVGKSQVVQAGIIDAVDVWSWVGNDTEVCFLASGALVVFLDAKHAPRTVETLPIERRNEYTCARIPHHGSVVLLRSLPAGLSPPVVNTTPKQPLQDCMVTLSAVLNLREYPHGKVLAELPAFVSLTALDRTPGWFKVDYHGKHGWISADFVTPRGDCA